MDEYIVTDNLITYINSKGEEHCPYCKYQDTCHGIACYGGEPIEPPCCYETPDHYLDFDIIIEEMKEREEKDMNKVLKLYEERKLKEIDDKYDKKVDDDYNAIEVVKEYNELVNNFENKLEELFTSLDNFDNSYLVTQCDSNCYKYALSEGMIKNKIMDKYAGEKITDKLELDNLVGEVDAQLSLSDDLTYQLEVLNRYGIIDKKTNKMTV